ncbi:MAG: DUF962 domain-containing protein [Proteobacteria bacterium]|nr:DUF962 domain-containing protein [Pseudomonadota bacterium]
MRTVEDWLGEYALSHQHPANKLLHWICVPAIVLAVMGFFWAVPVPASVAAVSPWLNWATGVAGLTILYYLALSPRLAVGIALAFAGLLLIVHGLAGLPWPLWKTSLTVFVLAWIGQFVGHLLEGRRPSFFKDVQFLLIGPLWLLAAFYRRIDLRY